MITNIVASIIGSITIVVIPTVSAAFAYLGRAIMREATDERPGCSAWAIAGAATLAFILGITWYAPPRPHAGQVMPAVPTSGHDVPCVATLAPAPTWASHTPTFTSTPTATATPSPTPTAFPTLPTSPTPTATSTPRCGRPPEPMQSYCPEAQRFDNLTDLCLQPPTEDGTLVVRGTAVHADFGKYRLAYWDPRTHQRHDLLTTDEEDKQTPVFSGRLFEWDFGGALHKYGAGWYTLELHVVKRDGNDAYESPCRVRVCLPP
jgi:hypothetical protein